MAILDGLPHKNDRGRCLSKKFNLPHPCFQNMNSAGTKFYPLNVTTTDSLRTYDFLMISIIDTLVSTLSNAPLACLCSSRNPPQQRVTKPKFLSRGHQAILTAIWFLSMEFAEENSEQEIQNETRGTENSEGKEQRPTREITQTDHLNRRLLDAFLTRLNSSETAEVPTTDMQNMVIDTDQEFEDTDNYTDNQSVKE